MQLFKEMCDAYAQSQTRKLEYFRKMHQQAVALRDGFAQYIEAPERTYEAEGRQQSYVRLLKWKNGEFEVADGMVISGADEDMVVWFGLAVTIEQAPNAFPKQIHQTQIGLKWLRDAMEVHVPELDRVIVAPRIDGDVVDYSDVYQSIASAILNQLAFDPFAGSGQHQ